MARAKIEWCSGIALSTREWMKEQTGELRLLLLLLLVPSWWSVWINVSRSDDWWRREDSKELFLQHQMWCRSSDEGFFSAAEGSAALFDTLLHRVPSTEEMGNKYLHFNTLKCSYCARSQRMRIRRGCCVQWFGGMTKSNRLCVWLTWLLCEDCCAVQWWWWCGGKDDQSQRWYKERAECVNEVNDWLVEMRARLYE